MNNNNNNNDKNVKFNVPFEDIKFILSLINTCIKRGTFKAEEMEGIGKFYNKYKSAVSNYSQKIGNHQQQPIQVSIPSSQQQFQHNQLQPQQFQQNQNQPQQQQFQQNQNQPQQFQQTQNQNQPQQYQQNQQRIIPVVTSLNNQNQPQQMQMNNNNNYFIKKTIPDRPPELIARDTQEKGKGINDEIVNLMMNDRQYDNQGQGQGVMTYFN